MLKKYLQKIIPVLVLPMLTGCGPSPDPGNFEWMKTVRISGNPLTADNIEEIIHKAGETHVFGIEVDNDITGRYDSFLQPDEKLAAIRKMTEAAHRAGNRTFVYIAGLECITANADKKEHTFLKDHPDWVQRNREGKAAVFGGKDAFWIKEGDEDVWISPFAEEWRAIFMEHVRKIAATGIDGIYVDIPYWMTHFEGWENTWASFDEYTVAAFREQTGNDAVSGMRLGDFSDAAFRRWVDFRIGALTDFMAEINREAKSVNPDCAVIAEIYPGIDFEAVRVGADVYRMYEVVDAIAHEYSAGAYMASDRDPFDWFDYMIGMYTFRAFAGEKPTWMLSYSWDGEKNIDPADAMENLFLAQTMAGANPWDARGHVMSGSNNNDKRKQIYQWIGENEKKLYAPRKSLNPVGVYFSPQSRDYFADQTIPSFRGVLHYLLQTHLPFEIVTPRTISRFSGSLLVLPETRCIGKKELTVLDSLLGKGTQVVATGEAGWYDLSGNRQRANRLQTMLMKQLLPGEKMRGGFVWPECPARKFYRFGKKTFDQRAYAAQNELQFPDSITKKFFDIIAVLFNEQIAVKASPYLTVQFTEVNGTVCLYFANFKGLKGKKQAKQLPEENVEIIFRNNQKMTARFIPYLGKSIELKGQRFQNGVRYEIPVIEKGGIFRLE